MKSEPSASSRLTRVKAFADSAIGRAVRAGLVEYFRATIEGAERIPAQGGALLVGNHAMTGLDSFVLGALIPRERDRYVCFLGERNLWKIPLLREFLDAVGAVPGVPETAVELLLAGELVCVYPGGTDDSWKLTPKDRYRLQWGARAGFARVAMRARVPIVPIAALGIDDMYDVIARERIIGRTLMGSRRYDLPIAFGAFGTLIPKRVTQRFLVQNAIDTSGDPDDASDVERVRAATYAAIEHVLSTAR